MACLSATEERSAGLLAPGVVYQAPGEVNRLPVIRDGRVPPFSAVYYVYRVPSTPIISFICSIFEILN